MGIETVIITLIWIAVIVGVAFLILWVLGEIGVPLPANVVKIGWVVVALIVILILWRAFGSSIPGF